MLALDSWAALELLFGPHSVDQMALNVNAQRDSSGAPIKHFTPFASPTSHGVNLFAQHISRAENACFPYLLCETGAPFSQGSCVYSYCA